MGEESRTVAAADQASAIARHIVRVTAEYTGRGPTRARATFGEDLVTVILSENFTKGERSLVSAGQGDSVLNMRRAFQMAMREAYTEGVEAITGRTVVAFMSDHHLDPDIAVEIFIFEPFPTNAPETPADGST